MCITNQITCWDCGQIFHRSEFGTDGCPTCGWSEYDAAGSKLAEVIDADIMNSFVEANKAFDRADLDFILRAEIEEAQDLSEFETILGQDDKVLKWQEDMEKLTSCCVTLMGFCQRFGRFSDEDKVREMFRRIGNELYRESGLEVTDAE